MAMHDVVSQEEWLEARRALLAEEKAWTRERDRLAEKRRALPRVKVTAVQRLILAPVGVSLDRNTFQ